MINLGQRDEPSTAILLLFRGLFGLWVFGSVAAYGLDTVLEAPWLFADLPFDLVMIFMSIAIFVGSRRFAPRGIMVAVCTLSAILYACDLAWYPDDWWENKLLDAIGILADLGLIALSRTATFTVEQIHCTQDEVRR